MNRLLVASISLAMCAACASPKPEADTLAVLPPPDTVKPMTPAPPATLRAEDTTKAATKTTKTGGTTKKTENPNIGRDSVRTPRGSLPTIADTAKKPPL